MTGQIELKTAEDLKKEFLAERERLAKLWDAYEAQEKEVTALKNKIGMMERELSEKDRIVKSLKDVLEARDRENRELEIEVTGLRGDKASFEPKIGELTSALRVEKERFAKLFRLAEELDEELRVARREISARDEWFRIHVDQLRGIGKAIDERDTLIEGAKSKKITGDYKASLEKLNVPDDVSKPNI
jgi:chromosome segregation ATPase